MKKQKFFCSDCDFHFQTTGKINEKNDPIFGKTWYYVARCPKCQSEVKEEKKELKGDGLSPSSASCPTGTCPFAR